MTTLRTNFFVSSPEFLSRIKMPSLRKIMMMGARLRTPLNKKATFDYTWVTTSKGDMVNEVRYYSPSSQVVDKVFKLNDKTMIPLADWYRLMSSVTDFDFFFEEVEEKERVRMLVKQFETAAKRHGIMQQAVALGDVGEQSAYDSGKALKTIREELFKELEID